MASMDDNDLMPCANTESSPYPERDLDMIQLAPDLGLIEFDDSGKELYVTGRSSVALPPRGASGTRWHK